jgi:protein involved in polysaccharide export with SLBB domain
LTVIVPSKTTSTTIHPDLAIVVPPAPVRISKVTVREDLTAEEGEEAGTGNGVRPFTPRAPSNTGESVVFVAPVAEPGAGATGTGAPAVATPSTTAPPSAVSSGAATPATTATSAAPDTTGATAATSGTTEKEGAVTTSPTAAGSEGVPAATVETGGQLARPEASGIMAWRTGMLKPSPPTIQPDTVLWVSVTEDPSLNGRYSVNNSSAIDFGYVGLVFLQDMTVEQAEVAIKNVLEGRYLNHATVSVKMAKASYDFVGVMGNVEVPGEIKIGPGSTITLNDALRRAGGLRGNKESNRVKIVRGGLRTPFGPAAEGEVLSLVTENGQLRIPDVFLRNNDLAYVFASESPQLGGVAKTTGIGKRVILLGEVPRRGVVEFAENEPCTLMYLLFKIGGLPRFAKADRIQIVRRGKDGREKAFVVNGESLMNEGNPQDDVVLESGDRVIVPARKIAFF